MAALRVSRSKLKLTWNKFWVLDRRKCSSHAASSYSRKSMQTVKITLGDRSPLILSFGKYARFADGNAVARLGDTSVLTTAVCKSKGTAAGFVPLTVDYRQKAAAAGRIPTNFLRREIGTTDKEILTSRMIDRSLRPLFPKGFGYETQLVCNLMAVDGVHDPDVLSINAASAALALSDIPWNGPVGAVRVGVVDGQFLINPTRRERSQSDLNLIVSGTKDNLTVMLEAEAKNIDKRLFLTGIQHGLEGCAKIASQIAELQAEMGVQKREFVAGATEVRTQILEDMRLLCLQRVRAVFHDTRHDKTSRDVATFSIRDTAIQALKESYPDVDVAVFHETFSLMTRTLVADMALDESVRVDGRRIDQLRQISCEVDLHKPLHGSALFQRGQTQVFCTVALDSLESALKSDPVSVLTGGVKEKNFFLHYEFPPYATNEIGRTSSAGRRELGHGALAEKALKTIIPQNFPFTIRLSAEVLESNGSSSMATVCAGSLSLLDAGVKISQPAAGIAMGLVSRTKNDQVSDYKVLTDILGLEDYLGDMDFKLAGTQDGITALQADIKLPGLPFQVVQEAMVKGHDGIREILVIMNDCLADPRSQKNNWPVSKAIDVPVHKRGKFLGPGGLNLKRLTAETGVRVTPRSDPGQWTIFAPNADAMKEADEVIETLLTEEKIPEFEFGAIYTVKVVEIRERGLMVELHPGMDPVMLHNSQITNSKISHPSALGYEVGQEIQVKYYGRDPVTGSIRLSRKVLTMSAASAVKNLKNNARRTSSTDTEDDSTGVRLSPFSQRRSSELRRTKDRRKFYFEEVYGDGLNNSSMDSNVESSREAPQKSEDRKEVKNGDQWYYEIDVWLNKLMKNSMDLNDAVERLGQLKKEIESTRKKHSFLSKTATTNRILAEAFMNETYDKHQKLVLQRKAVEESIRNYRLQARDIKAQVDKMRTSYFQASADRENPERSEPLEVNRVYEAVVLEIMADRFSIQINKRSFKLPLSLLKSKKTVRVGETVRLKYEGLDPVTVLDVFSEAADEAKEATKFDPFALMKRDTWSISKKIKGIMAKQQEESKRVPSEVISTMKVEKEVKKSVKYDKAVELPKSQEFVEGINTASLTSLPILQDESAKALRNFIEKQRDKFLKLSQWRKEIAGSDHRLSRDLSRELFEIHDTLDYVIWLAGRIQETQNHSKSCRAFMSRFIPSADRHLVQLERAEAKFIETVNKWFIDIDLNARLLSRDENRRKRKTKSFIGDVQLVFHELQDRTNGLFLYEMEQAKSAGLNEWLEFDELPSFALEDNVRELIERRDVIEVALDRDRSNKKYQEKSDSVELRLFRESLLDGDSNEDWLNDQLKKTLLEECDKYLELESELKLARRNWEGNHDETSLKHAMSNILVQLRDLKNTVKFGFLELLRQERELNYMKSFLSPLYGREHKHFKLISEVEFDLIPRTQELLRRMTTQQELRELIAEYKQLQRRKAAKMYSIRKISTGYLNDRY